MAFLTHLPPPVILFSRKTDATTILTQGGAVNNWSKEKAKKYIEKEMLKWSKRSKRDWKLNVNYLKRYVRPTRIHLDWLDKYPQFPTNPVEARAWAAEMLESNALVLDTETTGLPKKHRRSEIIQISVLTMSGQILFESLVKSKYKIPKRTIKINGITNEMVADRPMFPEVFDEINEILSGRTVIAYKARFDREMLAKTCEIYDLATPDCDWYCAMWAHYIYNGSRGGFPALPNAMHNSTKDCQAILDLLHEMVAGKGEYYGKIDYSQFENQAIADFVRSYAE